MIDRWHILAFSGLLAATLVPGCYLAHEAGAPPRSGSEPTPEAPSDPCGCAPGELCVESCWGERACAPEPGLRPACDPSVGCCYLADPCEARPSYGSCVAPPGVDGILRCACATGPLPAPAPPAGPPPADGACGVDVCAADEVCVEPCDALAPACVERGEAACDDEDCACFEVDPCGRTGPGSTCVDVRWVEGGIHVICACAGPPADCEAYLDGAPVEACDPASFGTCQRPIDGVACCARGAWCEAGEVVEQVDCVDDCAQGCELIEDREDCLAFGCEHFVSDGCFDEPAADWILGPACLRPRTTRCAPDDDECPPGQACLGFPYDPCAGMDCDACGAVDYWCTAARPRR